MRGDHQFTINLMPEEINFFSYCKEAMDIELSAEPDCQFGANSATLINVFADSDDHLPAEPDSQFRGNSGRLINIFADTDDQFVNVSSGGRVQQRQRQPQQQQHTSNTSNQVKMKAQCYRYDKKGLLDLEPFVLLADCYRDEGYFAKLLSYRDEKEIVIVVDADCLADGTFSVRAVDETNVMTTIVSHVPCVECGKVWPTFRAFEIHFAVSHQNEWGAMVAPCVDYVLVYLRVGMTVRYQLCPLMPRFVGENNQELYRQYMKSEPTLNKCRDKLGKYQITEIRWSTSALKSVVMETENLLIRSEKPSFITTKAMFVKCFGEEKAASKFIALQCFVNGRTQHTVEFGWENVLAHDWFKKCYTYLMCEREATPVDVKTRRAYIGSGKCGNRRCLNGKYEVANPRSCSDYQYCIMATINFNGQLSDFETQLKKRIQIEMIILHWFKLQGFNMTNMICTTNGCTCDACVRVFINLF